MEVEAPPGTEPLPASRWSGIPCLLRGGWNSWPSTCVLQASVTGSGSCAGAGRGGMLLAFPGDDVPDEFSYAEGAQTDVLGPASLAVVAATGVHAHSGPELPEALYQVLLVDTTLTLRVHARRIENPEEYDGHLFLDGPVMLDAVGLEEAVSACLADASGTRTDGYQRAVEVVDLAGGKEEVPALARAAERSELVRLMSSVQQQVADATGTRSLQVSQQRMPSLFGPPAQGTPPLGKSLPPPPGRLPEPARKFQQPPSRVVKPSYAPPVPTPPQVPEDPLATTDPQTLLMQALLTQTQALPRLLARDQGADGDPMASLSADPAQSSDSTGVRGAAARDRLLHLHSSSPGELPRSSPGSHADRGGNASSCRVARWGGTSQPDCRLREIRRLRRAARARPPTAGSDVGTSRRLVRQDGSGDGYTGPHGGCFRAGQPRRRPLGSGLVVPSPPGPSSACYEPQGDQRCREALRSPCRARIGHSSARLHQGAGPHRAAPLRSAEPSPASQETSRCSSSTRRRGAPSAEGGAEEEGGREGGELLKPNDTISDTLFASCCTRWVLRARTPFSHCVKNSLLATERAGRASARLFPLPLPFPRVLLVSG